MLQLQPIEFFLRALPEGFIFILAIYSFSKTKINKKKYIISAIISSLVIFLVRMLPITYGVHTILSMIITMFIAININKIDVIKIIRSMLVYIITQFTIEGMSIFIMKSVLKMNMDEIFLNPSLKIVYGIPSLIMLLIAVGGYYIIKFRKGELIDV